MKITIEIPKEFEVDYNKDKFYEYFSRVLVDIKDGCLCGTYEEETTKMFIESFENAKEEKYDIKEFVEYIISECFPKPCEDDRYIFITKSKLRKMANESFKESGA